MLEQTQKLKTVFSDKEISEINNIIEQIEREGQEYKTINLWKFDQTIGGIGGYCQGCNPARSNPFQGTEFRNAYRCLQYVRSDIDILDDKTDRTFHADDAIICYFACRIVSRKILLMIDEETEKKKYEIDWDKYGMKINRF